LVGITTFFVKEGQNLNFALPTELLASLNSKGLERPSIEAQDPLFQALVWTLAGHQFLAQQQSDQALSAFEQALRIQPDFADAWAGLASAYESMKKYPEAAKSWEEAVRLRPNVAVYWYSLGLTYQKLLRFDDAIHSHEQAVALKPDYCEAWMRLGSVYWLKGDNAKVIEIYQMLKTLDCDDAEQFFRTFVLPH
jgi:tetratricopeptide (TPR) repeat protein